MNNYLILDSRYDEIGGAEIADFIEQIDNDFNYPIKDRPGFLSYCTLAKKFLDNGIVLFCREKRKLTAVTVIYADPKQYIYAYIPFTGIEKSSRGTGIIQTLMNRRKELCKKIGMKGVLSSCSVKNQKMISILESAGYTRITNEREIGRIKQWNPKDNWKKAFSLLMFEK